MEKDPAVSDKWYDIFQDHKMLIRLGVLILNWFSLGVIFYGLNLARRAPISNSIHLNIIINGLLDFLSELLAAAACYKSTFTRYKMKPPVFMINYLVTSGN